MYNFRLEVTRPFIVMRMKKDKYLVLDVMRMKKYKYLALDGLHAELYTIECIEL